MDGTELASALSALSGIEIVWTNDTAVIVMNDGVELYLEYLPESDVLYLFGYAGSVDVQKAAKTNTLLMEANLFGKDTGGTAVFAIDSESNRYVLWDRVRLGAVSFEQVQARLSAAYLALAHWREKLKTL